MENKDDLEQVKRALRTVAQRHNMSDAQLDAQGGLELELCDGRTLCLEYLDARGKLFLHTPLTPLPADTLKRQAMLEQALRMNCLETAAEGSVAVLDVHGKTLLLQTALAAAAIDADGLDRAMSRLLEQRDGVLSKLTAGAAKPAAPGASAARKGWAGLRLAGRPA